MRLCLWVMCPAPADSNKPSVIRRWVTWPCVPRIGEKYRWYLDEDYLYFDEPNIGRVMDVIHEPVHRTLWDRLIGKPSEVIMVVFHVSDQGILEECLEQDPRWVCKDRPVDFD